MLKTTVDRLSCPARAKSAGAKGAKSAGAKGAATNLCGHALQLREPSSAREIEWGALECTSCQAAYPILAGVAIVVRDVRGFLLEHIKGISRIVPESRWPREWARELKAAHAERVQDVHHIEDDLEAERVISLYLMNHYLRADTSLAWWRSSQSDQPGSPVIEKLIREHWDHGPLDQIAQRLVEQDGAVIELGCGVGGLARRIQSKFPGRVYLGVDSSFSSIALARHLVLGAPYLGKVRIPEDLLQGPVTREVKFEVKPDGSSARRELPVLGDSVDFVVGELDHTPVKRGQWEVAVALNAIDMLEEPAVLPELKKSLLKAGGLAIQSCPYIWHESVAKKLRARLPAQIRESALAVEWLYERAGLRVETRENHVPWLFFKHLRQLEVYSVHLFTARS